MIELVVVGASMGGLRAVSRLLAGLPVDLPWPVVIAQHRVVEHDGVLVALLARHSRLPVEEIEDKTTLRPGRAYLAPADYHTLVEAPGLVSLSTEAPVQYARPSIDLLFESAARVYRERVAGLILTGASADGAAGLRAIKAQGGLAFVQDPASAECRVMPAAALAATVPDLVLPLEAWPAHLRALAGRRDDA